MRKRVSTITEEYSPAFRRRISTKYLSLSLPSLEDSFDHEENEEQQSDPKKQRFLERTLYNMQSFEQNNKRIHRIIDQVDEMIKRRMEMHENQLLNVVRSQIDRISEESRKIVAAYNEMIEAKNKQTQIHSLQNEVAYFQAEALKLFNFNKQLVQENKQYKQLLKNKDAIIQDLNQALKSKTKKLLKQKLISNSHILNQAENNLQRLKMTGDNTMKMEEYSSALAPIKSEQISIKKEIFQFPTQNSVKMREPPCTSSRYDKNRSNLSTKIGSKSRHKRILNTETALSTFHDKDWSKNKRAISLWKFKG